MTPSIIAVIISGVVCILNLVSFIITRNKDSKEAVTEDMMKIDGIKESLLKVNMKLDQVCATTIETRTDIKSMNMQVQNLEKEVLLIKQNEETMWKRIDELRSDVNNLKEI